MVIGPSPAGANTGQVTNLVENYVDLRKTELDAGEQKPGQKKRGREFSPFHALVATVSVWSYPGIVCLAALDGDALLK